MVWGGYSSNAKVQFCLQVLVNLNLNKFAPNINSDIILVNKSSLQYNNKLCCQCCPGDILLRSIFMQEFKSECVHAMYVDIFTSNYWNDLSKRGIQVKYYVMICLLVIIISKLFPLDWIKIYFLQILGWWGVSQVMEGAQAENCEDVLKMGQLHDMCILNHHNI